MAKRFLAYLHQRNVAVEVAKPADVESYLQEELRRFRRVHQCLPTALDAWHHKRSAPIRLLLRTVQRQWPPVVPPTTPLGQGQCLAMDMWFIEREKNLFAGHLRRDFLSSRA